MKTRQGFVSNSSSSSFILALPRKPESAEELHSWMFPTGPTTITYCSDVISSQQAAETVFRDISEATSMTFAEVVEEFNSGTVCDERYHRKFPEYPRSYDMSKEDSRKAWDEYNVASQRVAEECATDFEKDNPEALFFKVEYSDNDGDFYCTMEHGEVFSNLKNVRFSHH